MNISQKYTLQTYYDYDMNEVSRQKQSVIMHPWLN